MLASGATPDKDTYTIHADPELPGATALRIEALTDPSLPDNGPGRAGNFVLTGLTLKVNGQAVQLSRAYADFTQDGFDANQVFTHNVNSGWAIHPGNGKPHTLVVAFARPVMSVTRTPVEIVLENNSRYGQHVLGHFRLSFTTDVMPGAAALPTEVAAILTRPSLSPKDEEILRNTYFMTTRCPRTPG